MTAITINLPTDAYRRLHDEADRMGKSVETVAQDLLLERLATPAPEGERERATEILRAAGLHSRARARDESARCQIHGNPGRSARCVCTLARQAVKRDCH